MNAIAKKLDRAKLLQRLKEAGNIVGWGGAVGCTTHRKRDYSRWVKKREGEEIDKWYKEVIAKLRLGPNPRFLQLPVKNELLL